MMTDDDMTPSGRVAADIDLDIDGDAVTHDHLLAEAISITQPKSGYRVGTDAVLLAAAVSTSKGRVLDLGAGAGGVFLCLAHRHAELHLTAIEKHPQLAELAGRNAAANGFAGRVRVVACDMREMSPVLAGSFDHVVSNPPYHDARGTRPRNEARALAHMGDDTEMGDWVRAAIGAVKPRGRITFICRADRAAELAGLFAVGGAGETVMFPLWPREGVPAGRVIVEVRRDVEGPGAVLPGLVLHREDGQFTDRAMTVMRGAPIELAHPARSGGRGSGARSSGARRSGARRSGGKDSGGKGARGSARRNR